ncbi:unnamed protein product, partial [Prunus brigantina]
MYDWMQLASLLNRCPPKRLDLLRMRDTREVLHFSPLLTLGISTAHGYVCTHRGMWCASEMKRQRNEHDEVTVTLRALDMFCKQLQLHLSNNIDENTVTLAIKACQCQIHGFAVSSRFASYTTVSNS